MQLTGGVPPQTWFVILHTAFLLMHCIQGVELSGPLLWPGACGFCAHGCKVAPWTGSRLAGNQAAVAEELLKPGSNMKRGAPGIRWDQELVQRRWGTSTSLQADGMDDDRRAEWRAHADTTPLEGNHLRMFVPVGASPGRQTHLLPRQ